MPDNFCKGTMLRRIAFHRVQVIKRNAQLFQRLACLGTRSALSGCEIFEIFRRLWPGRRLRFWRVIIGIGLFKNAQRQFCGGFGLILHLNLLYRGGPPKVSVRLRNRWRNENFCNAAMRLGYVLR